MLVENKKGLHYVICSLPVTRLEPLTVTCHLSPTQVGCWFAELISICQIASDLHKVDGSTCSHVRKLSYMMNISAWE
jgi:hypothetical protein